MSKFIVIDREYASGGREVGKILSKELNFPLYDGELLIKEAERFGYNLDVLKYYDEKPSSFWLDNIASLNSLDQNMLDPTYEIFELTEKVIGDLAKESPCIFIGRCADYVLKKSTNVLSVFIYSSSLEKKIKRAIEVDNISESHAKGYILKKDKQRSQYYHLFTGNEWGQKKNYDICLNSATLGYEGCANIIKDVLGGSSEKPHING